MIEQTNVLEIKGRRALLIILMIIFYMMTLMIMIKIRIVWIIIKTKKKDNYTCNNDNDWNNDNKIYDSRSSLFTQLRIPEAAHLVAWQQKHDTCLLTAGWFEAAIPGNLLLISTSALALFSVWTMKKWDSHGYVAVNGKGRPVFWYFLDIKTTEGVIIICILNFSYGKNNIHKLFPRSLLISAENGRLKCLFQNCHDSVDQYTAKPALLMYKVEKMRRYSSLLITDG